MHTTLNPSEALSLTSRIERQSRARVDLRREIMEILEHGRVPYHTWQGHYDLESLVNFCESGEMHLERNRDGATLHVNVAVVTIRHITSRAVSELYEAYCIEKGRRFTRPFDGSVAGKIHMARGERPADAARREMREELGQTEPSFLTARLDLEMGRVQSVPSDMSDYYHGLSALYHRYHFRFNLAASLWHDEYIAAGRGRVYHFLWKTMTV